MKKIIAISTLVILSACNTVEGAGKDIRTAGQKIENAASKSK